MNIRTICINDAPTWAIRLKKVISQIDSEYILFTLEDAFITSPVNTELFEQAVEMFDKIPQIGSIKFFSMPRPYDDMVEKAVIGFENYSYTSKKYFLRNAVCTTLWKKDCLLKMLFDSDTPWSFEREGAMRSLYVGYDFVMQNKKSHPTFEYYIHPKYNLGIISGKWLCDNRKLFEDNGIYGVNFEKLGIHGKYDSFKELNTEIEKKYISEKVFKNIFYIKVTKKIKKLKIIKWLLWKKECLRFKKYYKKNK